MKKIILLLSFMLMASPALGQVAITVSDGGDGWAVISYDATAEEPDFVRAFALDITASNDVNFVAYDSTDANYWVYPGSIDINDEGGVNDVGSPIAPAGYPDVTLGGLDTNGVTIEMGALFPEGGDPPASTGVLIKLKLDPNATADAAEVCVVGNAIRGKIVLNTAESLDIDPPACAVVAVEAEPCPCRGDIGSSGGLVPDGTVNIIDLNIILGTMMGTYPTGDVTGLYDISCPF